MVTATSPVFALIVVDALRGYLAIAEAVVPIQGGDGLFVALRKALAVAAVAQANRAGRLQEHALANLRGGEVAVAR